MTNFYDIPDKLKNEIFTEVGKKSSLPAYAAEKDWWVVQCLSIIFDMDIGKHLVFKGGTSLSKAWGLIERFSEDVDLAVDRSFFGFEGELGKSQRTKLRKKASNYITDVFVPELKRKFNKSGFNDVDVKAIEPLSSDQDPRIIEIYYPNVIESPAYIRPKVQIEIGSRSMREPFTLVPVKSLIDEYYPDKDFAQPEIEIPVVNAERTLLEKIFLLHEEFQRPEEKIRVDRLSRHLYDIYQLDKSGFTDKAIAGKELYETIVRHRYIFTKLGGVDYNKHNPKYINPIPPSELMDAWGKDYQIMKEQMIYGDSPSFDELIAGVRKATEMINNIGWEFELTFPPIIKKEK